MKKTFLYNTISNEIISEHYGGYFVDGKKPILPDHIVELDFVQQEYPSPSATQKVKVSEKVDLENKEYQVTYSLVEKTEREIFLEGWRHPEFSKRVIAPISLALTDKGVQLKAWCDLKGLPMINEGDYIHVYLNTIDPQFQTDIDTFKLTVQNI